MDITTVLVHLGLRLGRGQAATGVICPVEIAGILSALRMALDMKYFEEMEVKIPKGKVRTRFAPESLWAGRAACWSAC